MEQEAPPVAEEVTPAADQETPKKRGRKRGREKDEERGESAQKKKSASPVDRPSRERKSVERYSSMSPRKASAKKVLKIQQGPGEKLKDIPNVAFKLSKRKIDESLQVLHRILFGRQANVHFVKRNILQFSGFVWNPNEDKDRLRVKEKLEKCNKDRLLEFCNLLDIHMPKVATKKEEVSGKLLEFLESPHVTREVLLSEHKKGKKRRKVAKGVSQGDLGKASSVKEKKGLKKSVDGKAKKGHSKSSQAKEEDHIDDETIDKKEVSAEEKSDAAEETSAHSNSEAAEVGNEPEDPEQTKKSVDVQTDVHKDDEPEKKSPLKVVSPTKTKKSLSGSASMEADTEGKTKSFTKGSKDKENSSRKRNEKASPKKVSKRTSKRKVSQKKSDSGSDPGSSDISKKDKKKGRKRSQETDLENTKESKKRAAKGSKNVEKKLVKDKNASDVPSTEQLRAVAQEILEEVDFNVATLADIIRQLGVHFNTDLMDRKAEIKKLLEEVINEMTDGEEEEDAEDGDDGAEEGEQN
ncbi:hypothetical protein HPP92_003191 [Vanilla planifolia]|uniref:DEK-C domain-containing protein n=1 Tax=Vanilla planifolia TaxID=51239 RepID=A0A835RTY6_VANPL|nr:hypothetical protein HPP92_003191 [Vanilla planifolia]